MNPTTKSILRGYERGFALQKKSIHMGQLLAVLKGAGSANEEPPYNLDHVNLNGKYKYINTQLQTHQKRN